MTEGTNQASRCPIQDGFFISPSGKRQRLEDIRAIQTNMLKEPSFPDSQQSTMNIRSLGRFGKPVTFTETFAEMAVGTVCPILIKFYRSYAPPNPTMQDLRRSISGGYAQQCVHLTLAHVVHSGKCGRTQRFVLLTASLFSNALTKNTNSVVVDLEAPKCFSYRSGPTLPSAAYRLSDNGKMQYFQDGRWHDWGSCPPVWDFAEFPLLTVAYSGFDGLHF